MTAASFAPGSIITIFGTNLTTGVGFATDVQNPPARLQDVSVSIGGVAAALFYVSPTQINAVVDSKTPLGNEAVVITSPAGTQSTTVKIDVNAPAGLFSLFATGTRDGAILNAVTFLLGDFSTKTANSPTFLALFATGVNLSVTPLVTIGGVPVQVTFFGAAPCCDGLQQINVMLPNSLAGAGRVPVVLTQNGVASNTVQVVLLPPQGETEFPGDADNTTRSREIAGIAWIPGTSLVLVADENDDVIRVVDVKAKQVVRVIVLADGAHPSAIAVTADGATAVIAETGTGKVAVINLTTFVPIVEIATGPGPVRVAISGSQAVVVNADNDTVSIINLANDTVQKTLTVGHGPEGIAIDVTAKRAYVLDEDDGAVTSIDLINLSVISTTVLNAALRPESITLTGTGFALLTLPAAGADGKVILLDLVSSAQTMTSANPARSGGSTDLVFFNGKVYFANQTGGSVSVASFANGALGAITTIKVDLGPRALAIDAKDNLLVVSNEGSGTLVLIDLASDTVVGRIDAVQVGSSDTDDHSDRDESAASPAIQSMAPATSKSGVTLNFTITGTGLTGASKVVFDRLRGEGDQGDNGDDKNKSDDAFTVTNIVVNASGTLLTASVQIRVGAQTGTHVVRVVTPSGESSGKVTDGDIFTVSP
jgi:uncharacterized protein (TIGR03437 family)